MGYELLLSPGVCPKGVYLAQFQLRNSGGKANSQQQAAGDEE
jgi:hypothetical protein